MNQQKINYLLTALIVTLALIAGWFGVTLPVTPNIPDPLPQIEALSERLDSLQTAARGKDDLLIPARSFQTACYQDYGGNHWVADEGCTWTIEEGATLEIISGSTVSLFNLITSTLDGLTVNGNAVITGTTSMGGVLTATGGVVGNVTGNVVGAISATAPITVGGHVVTYTAPLTLTGVLTNVRLLYVQE